MGSFGNRLSRLSAPRPPGEPAPIANRSKEKQSIPPESAPPESEARLIERTLAQKPSLDILRMRITEVLERSQTRKEPKRPFAQQEDVWRGASQLPFIEEETALGPLHLARKTSPIAARFGNAALYPAVLADVSMLSLLALDPRLNGCDPKKALYLDTETTGLSGGTGIVPFLIGLAYFDEQRDAFVCEQMLLRKLGEETPMLDLLAARINDASMIVTYNGKSFDLPLLRTRMVMNRLRPFEEKPHLDLYHLAKRIHGAHLRSCSLISIEEHVLGHFREGDMPGREVALSFLHYVRTGDESGLAGAAEHNMHDVLAMIALLGFYGEPLGALSPDDLSGVATTLRRAGALDRARDIATVSIERGGGARARRVRGDIEKARGEKTRAIAEYEAALADASRASYSLRSGEPADGALRLELAKLYEHVARAFDKALDVVSAGTGECFEDQQKRRKRLERKAERSVAGTAAVAASGRRKRPL